MLVDMLIFGGGILAKRASQRFSLATDKTTFRAAANEAFDLSNNPSREEEWSRLAGAARSLSTGDVVVVEGDNGKTKSFLCLSFGWADITLKADTVISELNSARGMEERRRIASRFEDKTLHPEPFNPPEMEF